MKSLVSITLLVCALLAWSALARADTDLATDWLDGTTELTATRFDRLVKLAQSDPEVVALMKKATDEFGVKSAQELLPLFSLCEADTTPADSSVREGGSTTSGWIEHPLYPDLEDLASAKSLDTLYADRIEKIRRDDSAVRISADIRPDYAIVKSWVDARVCVQPKLSILEAYGTFVHELTHLVEMDALREDDLSRYGSEEEFLRELVLSPGQEVDAFIASYRAQIRLLRTNEKLPQQLKGFFNLAGELLVSRARLARVILASPPGGFGFGDKSFYYEYKYQFDKAAEREVRRRNDLAGLAELRFKQSETHRYNVEQVGIHNMRIYEGNIFIARRNEDRNAEVGAREALEREKQETDRQVRLVNAANASYDRLLLDIKTRDSVIARYRAHVLVLNRKASETSPR